MGAMMPQMPPQGGAPQVPPGLASLFAQGTADADQADQSTDPLQVLQDVIEQFPPLLVALKDPGDVDTAVAALRLLTGVQKRIMAEQGPGASAQAPQR